MDYSNDTQSIPQVFLKHEEDDESLGFGCFREEEWMVFGEGRTKFGGLNWISMEKLPWGITCVILSNWACSFVDVWHHGL